VRYVRKAWDEVVIYQSDSGCFVDLLPVQSYRGLKKLKRSILLRPLVQIILADIADFLTVIANVRCSH